MVTIIFRDGKYFNECLESIIESLKSGKVCIDFDNSKSYCYINIKRMLELLLTLYEKEYLKSNILVRGGDPHKDIISIFDEYLGKGKKFYNI